MTTEITAPITANGGILIESTPFEIVEIGRKTRAIVICESADGIRIDVTFDVTEGVARVRYATIQGETILFPCESIVRPAAEELANETEYHVVA